MPVLPANFFARSYLQGLIGRSHELLWQLEDAELVFAVLAFQRAAAGLDGLLADLTLTNHPNDKALHAPGDWATDWVGQTWTFKPGLVVRVERQFLVAHGKRVPTGRHRVYLNDNPPLASANVDHLHETITRFLLADWDELPSQLVEGCLSSLEG